MKARYLIAIALAGGAVYLVERAPTSSAEPVVQRRDVVARMPERVPETRAAIRAAEVPRLAVVAAHEPDVDDDADAPVELDEEHGAVQGGLTDRKTGERLAGVTVTVSSPALGGVESAITDEQGFYAIRSLPAGDYLVTFYYQDVTVERHGVDVSGLKTTPVYQKIDTAPTPGITLDVEYTRHIPVPGRVFESVLGAVAHTQDGETSEVSDGDEGTEGEGDPGDPGDDAVGISFSGGTMLENEYIVDGP